jgi:hypothetical protein
MSEEKLMSQKKPAFPVSEKLAHYLEDYNRITQTPVQYDDLLRFSGSIVVYDKHDVDTLWVRVYYNEFEREEIDRNLKQLYSIFHSDGTSDIFEFINIDAIDYCTFGNSKPFRIKVRNILNDNFVYFYVKTADASRIYGLEFEHMLSPYNLNFLVQGDTLIEEHIAGIPGDVFIKEYLEDCLESEKAQLAKEFVKFNERCTIRLLGDMRSYNYVIVPVHDFDHVVYRIRAIDFDQQSFEWNLKVYKPQFFKENLRMVKLVQQKLQTGSIEQYKREERSILAKRMLGNEKRINKLLKCMMKDQLSSIESVKKLRAQLYDYTLDMKFKRCRTMGQILRVALEFVRRNYEDVNMKRLIHG